MGFLFNWDSLHTRLSRHYEAWSYKKKKHKKIKTYRKSAQKEPNVKRCLLILDLKPLRSSLKGKHSTGREFQSLACARKETVDTGILVTSRNVDRKIMQPIRITSRPPSRIRKWNQSSQFRWTSSKVILIEKTLARYGSREAAREGPTV